MTALRSARNTPCYRRGVRATSASALALVVAAGCGAEAIGVRVGRDQLGTPRARLTGVMATDSGGHGEWIYAGDWTDAVTLFADRGRLCVELELRDPAASGLDDLELALTLDRRPVPVTIEQRAVAPLAAAANDDGRLSATGVGIRGAVCAAPGSAHDVELQIRHRQLGWRRDAGSARHPYQTRYRWTIVGG